MADNIDVKPSADSSAVPVATDVVSSVHYPVYKLAYGEDGSVTLVDSTNGLPVNLATAALVQQEEIIDMLRDVVQELKIMNVQLNIMTDERILKGDLE